MSQPGVCEEYRSLIDKAYSKFSRLRDFPPYGQNKALQFYFHKAFQVYTRLWKFQQDNRQRLVEAGLRRWEIGEIASRIGQLYYIYYLRTSDGTFLKESYIFYEAILNREYFKDSGKDVSLANKQLRYYARFIVICLLLNRWEMVHHLVRQLHTVVEDYTSAFHGADAKEWKTVAQEIVRFLKATTAHREVGRPLRYVPLLDGSQSSFPTVKKSGFKPLKLQNAVLVSHYHNEVKFSELTIDNYRMLQCLEWEPGGSFYRIRTGDSCQLTQDIVDPGLPPNPHKYILYRPGIQQLLLVLATACEELSADSALLLYVSASGKQRSSVHASSIRSSNLSSQPSLFAESSPDYSEPSSPEQGSTTANPNGTGLFLGRRGAIFYPDDLLPFTRKPLFLVIDSDSSRIFETLVGEERGEPVSLLLSPTSCPSSFKQHHGGSLFTYFLSAPLKAFCQMTGILIGELQQETYQQAEYLLSSLLSKWGDLLASSSSIHTAWARVLTDPFLRQLVLRFVLARACYNLHDAYSNRLEYIPRCAPPLPDEVAPRSKLVEGSVLQLARMLNVANLFTSLPPVLENGSQ